MKSLLVVCIGNICRSPMAEAMLAASLPHLSVSSAGVGALVGQPADQIACELMTARGLDLSAHRARQIGLAMCQQADLILTMDTDQRRYIETHYPLTRGKVFRLAEAAKSDVPDPFRRGQAAFEHALGMIDEGVQAWSERIHKFK